MGGGCHHRDNQEEGTEGGDAGGGVAPVVVAETHLDVVPVDVELFVALVRDLLAPGVLDQRTLAHRCSPNTNELVGEKCPLLRAISILTTQGQTEVLSRASRFNGTVPANVCLAQGLAICLYPQGLV